MKKLSGDEMRLIIGRVEARYPGYEFRIGEHPFTDGIVQARCPQPNHILPDWFFVGYCDDILRDANHGH